MSDNIQENWKNWVPGLWKTPPKTDPQGFPTTAPNLKDPNWSRLTVRGVRKIWDPETKSFQLPGTINKRLKPDEQFLEKGLPASGKAERAKAERIALKVAGGGQSGYRSLMPKPTAQKGETAQAFAARMKRYEKSQSLATRLTAQLKANRPPAVPPVAAAPQDSTTTPPPAPPRRPTTQNKSQIEVSPSQTAIDRYNRLLQQRSQQQSRPTAVPFSKSVPAPAAASLDKYKINKDWAAANPRLAQAQVARASGQPRADINKILYKPGTAAYGAAGKSEMEKQVDQMRQDREKMAKQREAEQTGPRAQSALPGGAYSPTATANMTQRTRNILGVKEQYDAYDLVLEYLFSQGHVDTLDEAHYVMMQMDGEYIQNIVEQEGFRSDGRYQLPDGRTMGPIPGAIRALFTGNLPKSRTYIPPSTQTPTNRPPAVPASKDDSGRLTDFGAGGGKAKLKQGMTVGQVERQGRRNMGDYSG